MMTFARHTVTAPRQRWLSRISCSFAARPFKDSFCRRADAVEDQSQLDAMSPHRDLLCDRYKRHAMDCKVAKHLSRTRDAFGISARRGDGIDGTPMD